MSGHADRDGLTVDCASLWAGSENRLRVRRRSAVEEASLATAWVVDGGLEVDATVRAADGAFIATGRVGGVWGAECRRCLREVRGALSAPLRAVFEEQPAEGETWPVFDARIDLGPPAREAALLALPLAPLCSQDCAGPVPDRFPTGPAPPAERPVDSRWAALSTLRFDE